MSNIFLAINYGICEGWRLEPFDTAFEALDAVKKGYTCNNEWKIVRELKINVNDEIDNKEVNRT